MNSQAAVFLAVGILLGGGLAIGVALVSPGATSTSTTTTASSPQSQASTVEGEVLLEAPFNGTTIFISVGTTVGGASLTPSLAVLDAQYAPAGDGSTGVFSSYYGKFVAAFVNSTETENVTLAVRYGGLSGSGSVSVTPLGGVSTITIVLGTPTPTPTENMTVADGSTACPAIGGAWDPIGDVCSLDTPVVDSNLTLNSGVTLINYVYLDGNINNRYATLNNAAGATIDTHGGTLDNYRGIINNGYISVITNRGGTIVNTGGIINNNAGKIYNCGGTIDNYGGTINNNNAGGYGSWIINACGGTINNNSYRGIGPKTLIGTINNNGDFTRDIDAGRGGVIQNDGGATVNNGGGVVNNNGATITNGGTINNDRPGIGTINNRGLISNLGTISNSPGYINNGGGGNIFNNGGTIRNNTGVISNKGGYISNSGTIDDANGTLYNDGGRIYNFKGGRILGNPPQGGTVSS